MIIQHLSKEIDNFSTKTKFNFQDLTTPLSVLNMTYPDEQMELKRVHGKEGLYGIMNYERVTSPYEQICNFEYKPEALKSYGNIFSIENIGKYSGKIESICKAIQNSTGIVLIYSRYLEGGLLPMALALEEMGFSRYSYSSHVRSFMKKKEDSTSLNPLTMKKKKPNEEFVAKYAMITGTRLFSQNNELDKV